MQVTGKTVDNKFTVDNVFYLVGTHGIPLEVVLGYIKDNGFVVDWELYVLDAMKDGAKLRSIRGKVLAAIGEIYGPVYLKGFTIRFDEFFAFNWYAK